LDEVSSKTSELEETEDDDNEERKLE